MYRERVLHGPVGKTIIKMMIPLAVGLIALIGFNVADSYFIGKLGSDQLAAMGFLSPIVMFLNFVALGLGVGVTSTIARAIGEGDSDRVRRYGTDSLILALVVVAFFVTLGFFTIKPLFTLLGATGHIYEYVREYMLIWYSGMIVVVIPMVGNSAMRATGDTKLPAIIMLIAAIVNVALDPLFIFGWGPVPAMGIKGAAWATVISRAATMVASLYFLIFKHKMITFQKRALSSVLDSWKRVLKIGIPAAFAQLMVPLYMSIMTAIIARYSVETVAAYGMATKIESFALIILMSLSATMVPFVGQNAGANNYQRVFKALKFVYVFNLVWGGFIIILFYYAATPIAALFSTNQQVVTETSWYLTICSFSVAAVGIRMMVCSTFNAFNKPMQSAAVVLINLFVASIPLALLLSLWLDVRGIFLGNMLGNLVAGIMAFTMIHLFMKKKLSI